MSPNTQQTAVRRQISIHKFPPDTQDPIHEWPPNTQQNTVRRWISISQLEAQNLHKYSWNSKETTGDRYEFSKDIGSVIKLMRDRQTNETVAIKFLERGDKIDNNVLQEITSHRSLRHPNILRFREVILTQTHLGIVMDYASGGALIDFINQKLLNEDEARNIFQQLIDGVGYCHSMQICHGDLKPENILFDGSSTPTLKISDFRYSKCALLDCEPKSFGTCQYTAPEIFHRRKYNGKIADVWSCGVILYVMLFHAYPFEDPEDPTNSVKIMQRILDVKYSIPQNVQISEECRHLISRIFVADPTQRITIQEIQKHAWFRKNLPQCSVDLSTVMDNQFPEPVQSIEAITKMISYATYRFLARIGS